MLGPEEFDKQTDEIKLPVKLDEQNKIAVEVRGEPGTYITVKILGSSIPDILTSADPDYVNLNQPATVTISALIESNLTPSSVNLKQYDENYIYTSNLGILYDDGTHGDRKAGDKDFITQIIISETSPKIFNYRVAALYKDNETIKKVLSDFFSINIANIPSATGVISPQGGTITLDGYATVTFPAGAFPSNTTVKVMATSSPETKEDFEDIPGEPHLPYEIRINSGYIAPETTFEVIANVPDSFIASFYPNYEIHIYAQIYESPDAPEIYGHFHRFISTFAPTSKVVRATLPKRAFTTMHHIEDTYIRSGCCCRCHFKIRRQTMWNRFIICLCAFILLYFNFVVFAFGESGCEQADWESPLEQDLVVRSPFNPDKDHYGIDYKAADGDNVRAVAEGTIIKVDYQIKELSKPNPSTGKKIRGWGWYVVIKHTDGSTTLYAHLREDSVKI